MYRAGQRLTVKRHILLFAGLFFILCAVVVVAVWFFQGEDAIVNTKPVTRTVVSAEQRTIEFKEKLFRFSLPDDWVMQSKDPYLYKLQATKKNASNRFLSIYVDTDLPAKMAVDRLLPVHYVNKTIVPGTISDDCQSFTGGSVSSAQEAQKLPDTPAKWEGVNFMCDLSHYNRNHVGIGSSDGINMVYLTGTDGVRHKIFFLYTDHNITPDYTILYEMLKSFRMQ